MSIEKFPIEQIKKWQEGLAKIVKSTFDKSQYYYIRDEKYKNIRLGVVYLGCKNDKWYRGEISVDSENQKLFQHNVFVIKASRLLLLAYYNSKNNCLIEQRTDGDHIFTKSSAEVELTEKELKIVNYIENSVIEPDSAATEYLDTFKAKFNSEEVDSILNYLEGFSIS